MARRKIRKNRTSLIANILLFILGLLTFVFVDATLGGVLILLSIILYGLYLWLTRHFAKMRMDDERHPQRNRVLVFGSQNYLPKVLRYPFSALLPPAVIGGK